MLRGVGVFRKDPTMVSTNRRVMVVDDSETDAFLLSQVLMFMGHTVEQVHNGREALNKVDSFSPDVMVLDIRMPEMDGCDLARRVRAQQNGSPIVLVAITASETPELREEALASGFNVYLGKPLEIMALQTLFDGLSTVDDSGDRV
jgi:CheY-like chemotaxis protein